MKRLPLLFALLLLPLTARADKPGMDLGVDEYYAITGCRKITGHCETTAIGSTTEGSIFIDAGAGETISTRIAGLPLVYTEAVGPHWQDGITSVWGRVLVYGTVSQHVARRVTGDTWVDVVDRTILVDASAGSVTVHIPEAPYHPGRRLTVKKISVNGEVEVLAGPSGSIDGEMSLWLMEQWQHVTIEAAPAGNYITGFTTDEWMVVGQ